MKEEDELLKKCGTKNPFMVPEGYFDNFSKELMNKLPEKEQTSTPQETITTWQRIKPWIYMAAMFCGLMFSVRVIVGDKSAAFRSIRYRANARLYRPAAQTPVRPRPDRAYNALTITD